MLMGSAGGQNYLADGPSGWQVFAFFLLGILFVSPFAIPSLMYHVGQITPTSLVLCQVCNVMIFATSVGLAVWGGEEGSGWGS